jgi:hypothetical protein
MFSKSDRLRIFKSMNKRAVFILLLSLTIITVVAQTKKKEEPKVKTTPVYLGNSNFMSGPVKERTFDSLLAQGLKSRDSVGRVCKVSHFMLTYGERNLYEDSVGNLIMLTDLLSDVNYADTLTADMLRNITGRTKAGDTVYFDNIDLMMPDGKGAVGTSMRFEIVK